MNPSYYSAPVAQRANKLSNKIVLGGIGLFLLMLLGGVLIAFSGGDDLSNQLTRAVYRQEQLIALTDEASDKIRSAELSKVNADTNLYLQSDLSILTALMSETGIKAVPKEIAAQEIDTTTGPRLEQALGAGRYDDTYAMVLSQKIDSQQALLREIAAKSNSPAAKQGVSQIYNKLESVQKQLNELK